MNNKSVKVRIAVTVSVDGGEPLEVGHKTVRVQANEDGTATIPADLRDILSCGNYPERCAKHKPVQHRDMRPAWCNTCGRP